MARHKRRRLWVGLEVVAVPKGTPRGLILDVLKESIHSKEYDLPDGWAINLRWKNAEKADMKIGEWTEELMDSAVASEGFNYAVLDYLNRQSGEQPMIKKPLPPPPPPKPPKPKKPKPKKKPKRKRKPKKPPSARTLKRKANTFRFKK
jgi:hypothetical protein